AALPLLCAGCWIRNSSCCKFVLLLDVRGRPRDAATSASSFLRTVPFGAESCTLTPFGESLNATRAQNRQSAYDSRPRTHFPVQQHGAAVRIQTRIRRARASDPANESAAAAHANSRRRSRRRACFAGRHRRRTDRLSRAAARLARGYRRDENEFSRACRTRHRF